MLSELLNYRKKYKKFSWRSSKLFILYYFCSNNSTCQQHYLTTSLKFEVSAETKAVVLLINIRSVIVMKFLYYSGRTRSSGSPGRTRIPGPTWNSRKKGICCLGHIIHFNQLLTCEFSFSESSIVGLIILLMISVYLLYYV